MNYADAGVSIDRSDKVKNNIAAYVKSTFGPRNLGGFGGFGGCFDISDLGYRHPVLVSSTDGVGTKLKLAFESGIYNTVGQDIVNHCVNDALVQGARPLFFLDYIASGRIQDGVVEGIVEGIAIACRENGCSVTGGETAEMPGFYADGEFDLAGTIVGVVEKEHMLDGSRVAPGDVLIGLPSSGLHTNGYSLARKVLFDKAGLKFADRLEGLEKSVGETLMIPHRSYLKPVAPLVEDGLIHAMAHLTGGGFQGNIPRVLPANCDVVVDRSSWEIPAIFRHIQTLGEVARPEMDRTFNMGIGMVLAVAANQASEIQKRLADLGSASYIVGRVEAGSRQVRFAGE